MIRNLFAYRSYIFSTFWTDLRFRYAGTALGFFWFFITPLLEVLIYTVVFSQLISVRSGGGRDISYVIFLISGLFPFLSFSQTINRGSNAIKSNAIYIRRSLVPAEAFVFKEAVLAGFTLNIYLIFLIPASMLTHNHISWHIILWPLLSILLSMLGFGISLSLANLRILFPDLGEVILVMLQLWRWTLPIMFTDKNFSDRLRHLMSLNPPYYFIHSFRDLLIENKIPSAEAWFSMFFWIIFFLLVSQFITRRLRSEVKDIL